MSDKSKPSAYQAGCDATDAKRDATQQAGNAHVDQNRAFENFCYDMRARLETLDHDLRGLRETSTSKDPAQKKDRDGQIARIAELRATFSKKLDSMRSGGSSLAGGANAAEAMKALNQEWLALRAQIDALK